MSNNMLVITLALVTLVLVLGAGIWQYRSVKRKQERLGETSEAATASFAHDSATRTKPDQTP